MDDDFLGQGKIKLLHRTDAGTLPLLHYLKSDNAPFLEQDSQSVDRQILKKIWLKEKSFTKKRPCRKSAHKAIFIILIRLILLIYAHELQSYRFNWLRP